MQYSFSYIMMQSRICKTPNAIYQNYILDNFGIKKNF